MSRNHYLQYSTFNQLHLTRFSFNPQFLHYTFLKLSSFKDNLAGTSDLKALTPKFPSPFELFWQIWALIHSIDSVLLGQVQLLNRSSGSNENCNAWSRGHRLTCCVLCLNLSIWPRPSLEKFFSLPTGGKIILVWEQGSWVKAGTTLFSQKEPKNSSVNCLLREDN